MKRIPLVGLFVLCALFAARPVSSQDPPDSAVSPGPAMDSCFAPPADAGGSAARGFDLDNLDRSVRPCDDFYEFAAGGWVKKNPVPPAYSSWNSFAILADHNHDVLHEILEDAAKRSATEPLGSNRRKLGDFYSSCMDEAAIEKAGLAPIQPDLGRIARLSAMSDVERLLAHLQRSGVGAMFRFGSTIDFKDSTQQVAAAYQGGLALPDRDYYLNTDEKSVKLRDEYQAHVARMFELMGEKPEAASADAKTVLAIETELAKASMDRISRRDPEKIYHRLTEEQLQALTPHFTWRSFFIDAGAPGIHSLVVGQPDFFKALDSALASVSLADWKAYLRWHLIHAAAPGLPSAFEQEDFNFFHKTLTGAKEMQPRWKRCVISTDRMLGEALGQVYVQKAFPPEAKTRALRMVQNIRATLRDDLSTLDWMSPETRKAAIAKLDAMNLKIGYPSKWKSYAGLRIDRGSYTSNVERAIAFEFQRDLDKIGKPVDRTEWGMTPPTVNAYYNPTRNEIVFPAGILQPPFYDPHRDEAMNYGGIGAVIGHEMTHGFDDQGAKFDGHGNLRNWWTPEDLANFKARGECIVKQFDSYEAEPGLHEQGKLVEGESIADFGGLTISFRAFETTLQGQPRPADIDGFTPEQRFFLAWAQVWHGNIRPEYVRVMLKTNPHPLGQFRAIGPLSNMPEFEKTWGCKTGDAMVRPAAVRCRIW
ncbi:MAG TPA: M13 family metallopeptidase [Candidatus Acidoferrales bacterium]|nr:M13 family metallopeptidase [Candidatus Acidoferrales bacterium]